MLLFAPYTRIFFVVVVFRETWQTFLQCFSHHQLVNCVDCWQFVVNASRISQSYFPWVWLCDQSLFFLLGLPPSFLASRGFADQSSRARALPLRNLKKKRGCLQSTADPCSLPGISNFAITVFWSTSRHSFYFSIRNAYSDLIENAPVSFSEADNGCLISSNNSRGRLFLFPHKKGTIIRGRRLFLTMLTGTVVP